MKNYSTAEAPPSDKPSLEVMTNSADQISLSGTEIHSSLDRFLKFFTALAAGLALLTASLPVFLTDISGLPSVSDDIQALGKIGVMIISYLGIAVVFHYRYSIPKWAPIAGLATTIIAILLYQLALVHNQFDAAWPIVSLMLIFVSPVFTLSTIVALEYIKLDHLREVSNGGKEPNCKLDQEAVLPAEERRKAQ